MDNQLKEEINIYNSLKSNALSSFEDRKYEKTLDYIHLAAKIARQSYLGIWYDDELEKLLPKIGKELKKESKPKKSHDKKVVFILSFLSSKDGTCFGHCQAFKHWTKMLGSISKNIYITHCYTSYNSSLYPKNIGDIPVYNLSWYDSYLDRIKDLINGLNNDAPDEIILFINPDDVIAITALSALDINPKIIFFNHADHTFWLGRTIIDTLIEFRDEGARWSKNYRNINNSQIVPLTTEIKPQKASKKEWGINEDSTVSISVGSMRKVLTDDLPYFKLIEELLEKFPNYYHIFITNEVDEDIIRFYFKNYDKIKDRFIIAGPIADLSTIYGVGDFLIETIPMNGDTVRIEAMACKLPVVGYYNEKFPLVSSKYYLPPDYPFIGSKHDELISYCAELIKDPEIRKKTGNTLYEYYLDNFSMESVNKTLKKVLSSNNNTVSIKNSKAACDYDLEYTRNLLGKDEFELNKELLFQSIFKRSKFSLKDNIHFYSMSLKKAEFKSMKNAISYSLLPFIGFTGISVGRKFGDRGTSLLRELFVK